MADLLEELVERNTRFHAEWKQTLPEGNVISLGYNVTDVKTRLMPEEATPFMPWRAFTLFNDGPNPVYVPVNEEAYVNRQPIRAGEQLRVDMKKRIIEKIVLYCDPGNVAFIRLFAKW